MERYGYIVPDDSIVRGTTSRRIVRLLREAGATEVHVRIASPPFKNPCFYGVDTSTYEELLCARMSVPEACEYIGADSLAYLSPDALLKAGNRCELCMACFTGNYPTSLYGTIDMLRRHAKLLERAEHAVRLDAAQFALFDLHAARQMRAVQRCGDIVSHMDVPRAGNDLHGLSLTEQRRKENTNQSVQMV